MEKVNIPEGENGDWKIKIVVPDRIDFGSSMVGRAVPLNEPITVLTRKGYMVMSDTPAEQRDHYPALRRATGSCLLNGLGIGMLLKNILLNPEVTDVTVVELSQDLIDLVAPYYTDPRVTIVCANAFDYQPPKGKVYDMVWHDIWDDICSDNLSEMTQLHRKYGRKAKWQGSWSKPQCLRQKKEWQRQERMFNLFSRKSS